jgi:hypothetical protein
MKNTLNLDHPLEVLKKNEEMLMRRVQKMVDSEHKYKIEEKIRGLRVVIAIVKQANAEYEIL